MYHASTTKWIHVSVVKSGMKIYLSISTINILIMIKNPKNLTMVVLKLTIGLYMLSRLEKDAQMHSTCTLTWRFY